VQGRRYCHMPRSMAPLAVCQQCTTGLLHARQLFTWVSGHAGVPGVADTVPVCTQVHAEKLQVVLDIVVAHQGGRRAADLVARLLAALVEPSPDNFRPLLRRIAGLHSAPFLHVPKLRMSQRMHSTEKEIESCEQFGTEFICMTAHRLLKRFLVY
jgi:hypothetical protein